MDHHTKDVTVIGAGVLGLWQAVTCARAGMRVHLIEKSSGVMSGSASALAGGMLAPDCEGDVAPRVVRDLGREGVEVWRASYSGVVDHGSLVVASSRDQEELSRFSKLTTAHERIDAQQLASFEPDLADRYATALFFTDEAHVIVPDALAFLIEEARRLDVDVRFGEELGAAAVRELRQRVVIDCRGMRAVDDPIDGTADIVSKLRGVRGERLLIRTDDINLTRPVRLLHPRHPVYLVPWGEGRFIVGATVVESADQSGASVRSILELLGAAFSLHPAFGEAEIVDIGAGVRPAFPDNVPRAVVRGDGRVIVVNGAYRHGYLLAPVLAQAVCRYLTTGALDHPLLARPFPGCEEPASVFRS